MNAVTKIQGSKDLRQTLSALSPGLKSLLAFEPSNHRAVSEIANNPAFLAEVKAALPAIKANATNPASHEDIKRIIGAKFATFRPTQRSDAEWAMFWADYFSVLEGLPASALEAAMEAVLNDPKVEHMPKPARIKELAMSTPNRAVKAYDRAKAAVEYQAPREVEKLPPEKIREMVQPIGGARLEPNDADKERVKRMMREFIEADEARKAKERQELEQRAPVSATPDETGISPQLREALMARGYSPN
ncbi:MAG: hypothetical protein LCH78_18035 [Proteobacteria bacterium]|nr:hypothetical protein [Pseudomonadota bacterium]